MARRYGKADIVQDRTFGIVAEADAIETDLRAADLQLHGVGPVLHLRVAFQQVEHQLHIGDGMFQLTVDDAEKIEWNKKL